MCSNNAFSFPQCIYRYVRLSGRLVVDDRLGRISLCLCFLCRVRQHVGVVLHSPSLHLDLVLEDQEDLWQVLQDGPLKGILFVYLSGQVVLFKHMYHGGCCKRVPLRCSQPGNHFNCLGSAAVKPSAPSKLLTRLQIFCTFFNTKAFSLTCQVPFCPVNAHSQCPCRHHGSCTFTRQLHSEGKGPRGCLQPYPNYTLHSWWGSVNG